MARKWFDGIPSLTQELPSDHPLKLAAQDAVADVVTNYQQLRFHTVAEQALQLAIAANGYLSDQAPWKAIKDPANRDQVAADLYAVWKLAAWWELRCNRSCLNSVNACCNNSMRHLGRGQIF